MFALPSVLLTLVVPNQLLLHGIVYLDRQGRDGHPVQNGFHTIELEGLTAGQADTAVREAELEADLPFPLCHRDFILKILPHPVQVPEGSGGRPRLQGHIRRHLLHVLDGGL